MKWSKKLSNVKYYFMKFVTKCKKKNDFRLYEINIYVIKWTHCFILLYRRGVDTRGFFFSIIITVETMSKIIMSVQLTSLHGVGVQ